MIRSKALLGAGAVLVTAALVSSLITAVFTQESNQQVQVEPTPTKSYARVAGTWTYDCEFPVQRPLQIMLTCADGGMIVTDITWKTWTRNSATGKGTYSQNMCDPNCAGGARVNSPVTIKLSDPFEHKGRNVLRTLDIEATISGDLPTGDASLKWDVSEFAVRMNWDIEG